MKKAGLTRNDRARLDRMYEDGYGASEIAVALGIDLDLAALAVRCRDDAGEESESEPEPHKTPAQKGAETKAKNRAKATTEAPNFK